MRFFYFCLLVTLWLAGIFWLYVGIDAAGSGTSLRDILNNYPLPAIFTVVLVFFTNVVRICLEKEQ